MTNMKPHEHVILPLDVPNLQKAVELVEQLRNHVGVFKIGLELLNAAGYESISMIRAAGAQRVFLDAKLHDIPNTVAGAMRGVVRHGAWCVTVHTMGGTAMLRAATEAAAREAEALTLPRPLVLGVTVLTSIGERELHNDLKVGLSLTEYAVHLARVAHDAGCDGVIASPAETAAIRAAISSPEFLIVTPGVRPAGSSRNDQARVHTPAEAMAFGANYLVIGRPIVTAPDPVAAARQIAMEIDSTPAAA